ncbi:class I SAM-dependent RNA methyltransferase [Celeribacter arenosi]|uniref:RNA methyltransferase n=1 Tax=Celeribacter arenosi TaxID=792649 RepID=A0ABP7KIT2_9RHOB
MSDPVFEIFAACPPGLEDVLCAEVAQAGFSSPVATGGGVNFQGGWPDVWRANLTLRGPTRILVRLGEFLAFHLAQLDKRSRQFPWGNWLSAENPVRVEVVTNRKSKIYHAGAAQERIERAISEELGAEISSDAETVVKVRIDDNNVIVSLDTSGVPLHKRGFKEAVGKAPMRETMAALLLRACGYNGQEPVLDPMCGSGTFPIEAAEMARGLLPGRARTFTFERLVGFDAQAFELMKKVEVTETPYRFFGSDRNVNVIGMATQNAERAGVGDICSFAPVPVSGIERPDGPPGLVIVNPPYGARVGKKKDLFALYGAFGDKMRDAFAGWRVGMVTSDESLAQATRLPWLPKSAPIAHGGLKVRLWQTAAL